MKRFCTILIITILTSNISANDWPDKFVLCPQCKTRNVFGRYLMASEKAYFAPSRFQYIFDPFTNRHFLYICRKCNLTSYMWDFANIPKHKKITAMLEKVSINRKSRNYTDIPMFQRFLIAEKVYNLLGKRDDFWGEFYRAKAYHLEIELKQYQREKNIEKKAKSNNKIVWALSLVFPPMAKFFVTSDVDYHLERARLDYLKRELVNTRKKALTICLYKLKNKKLLDVRKELLVISGAMRYQLGLYKQALEDFNQALKLEYKGKVMGKYAKGHNTYLTKLAKEFIEKMEKK